MKRAFCYSIVFLALAAASDLWAQTTDHESRPQFLSFIKKQAALLRSDDQPPASSPEWEARCKQIREHLQKAWGGFPDQPCPLEPRVLGTIRRDGYRVEKILFQTMPDVWMTASAYVPDGKGRQPAILVVHGHWRSARLDPVVQAKCIGAVKLGFFVLAVDAFGAGERAIGKKLGEYHGEMVAATLLPVGRPLSGIEVYENMRAVDYLLTRPEVDRRHIGITGASGGGNQTMYAGSWDDRFGAVVPVCSVGTYNAYLGTACCMCEVVPGALRFTEEWGILGRTAPRGLLVINATRDAFQFSVGEAKKSVGATAAVYRLMGRPENIRHAIFESPHDYNRQMREAMYGWMSWHLKGEGEGTPIAEPGLKTEDPEAIRCFPGDSRPAGWMTIPRFAAREARFCLELHNSMSPFQFRRRSRRREFYSEVEFRRQALTDRVFGGWPARTPLGLKVTPLPDGGGRSLTFHPEPGLTLIAREDTAGRGTSVGLAIVLDLEGADKARSGPLSQALLDEGWSVVTVDVRATGKLAPAADAIGRAPDHNSAEWALWIGRPLLGQWTWDVRRLLDALTEADGNLPQRVAVIGQGPAGLVALCVGATDDRVNRIAAVDSLVSYVTDLPYKDQRLGIMAPGIVRDVGDVQHLAALCAPRKLVVAGGVRGSGDRITHGEREEAFRFARRIWRFFQAEAGLHLIDSGKTAEIAQAMN